MVRDRPLQLLTLATKYRQRATGFSPGKKIKAEQVGMVCAGFVTTSIILDTTSGKYDY